MQSEQTAIYKSGWEAIKETNPASTLILELLTFRIVKKITFCHLSHSVCGALCGSFSR